MYVVGIWIHLEIKKIRLSYKALSNKMVKSLPIL
jgi:hypothetical protein